jgi:four helix bundle protein
MRLTGIHSLAEIDPRRVETRAFEFALAVARVAKDIEVMAAPHVLEKFCAHGTAVGAETAEALASSSRRAHLQHLTAARHAAFRVQFWVRLLEGTQALDAGIAQELHGEAVRLHTILTNLCKRARQETGSDAE